MDAIVSCEDLLKRMVAVNSVNPQCGGPAGGEERLAAWLEEWARAEGLKTRRLPVASGRTNLLISSAVQANAPWLLFDSHLDTVLVEGMSIAPFELTGSGDRLSGRGSCDTKGSGAAMLWALRNFARGGRRARNVGVLFTVDEESGMTGCRAFAALSLAEFLPHLIGIVVGEPTMMNPVIATNGVLRWRTITRGVAAHSSDPSRGKSAISAMMRVLAVFEGRYAPSVNRSHPLTGRAATSANLISGGSQVNIIPDYCAVECDRRLVPSETPEQALAERDQALAEFPGLEHDKVFSVPPLPESASAEFFAWAIPALAAAGASTQGRGAAFVTNGSTYAKAGAQVLVLGPGDAAQAHTHDEWVSRTQLEAAVRAYQALMDGGARCP